MKKVNLLENFREVIRVLSPGTASKISKISKMMGYTSTAQLHSALNGESMLSTKAIISLIENADVNPSYLFLGEGYMFLNEDSELENLKKRYSEMEKDYFSYRTELIKCKAELEKAIHRYNKLIDITSIAMDKSQKADDKEDFKE